MQRPDIPPAVCIVGRKNSGKTTLTVALAAELKRRGLRIATLKHGHHAFETDQPGRDSWRHFNEGEAEATIMAGTGKIALVMRIGGEPDPERLIAELYAGRGYDLVLIEGWKHGALPKIEAFRRALHDRPLYDSADADAAARFLAIVTDDAELRAACEVIAIDPGGGHVGRVADLLEAHFLGSDGCELTTPTGSRPPTRCGASSAACRGWERSRARCSPRSAACWRRTWPRAPTCRRGTTRRWTGSPSAPRTCAARPPHRPSSCAWWTTSPPARFPRVRSKRARRRAS